MHSLKWKFELLKSRYSLYFVIKKYEKLFSDLKFNRSFLNYEKVLMLIERMKVCVVEDKTFKEPFLWFDSGKKVLFYNPEIHPEKLTLRLGHELGHLICGHYTENAVYFKSFDRILTKKMERDADIVGYLCWIPTSYLNSINEYGWDAEEIVKDLSNCDTDYQFLYQNLSARLRIYKAYLKADGEITKVQTMLRELTCCR